MKNVFSLALLFLSQVLFAQKIKTDDNLIIDNLKKTINFLSDDKLEGRRTGSKGEKLAYQFIEKEFKKAGLKTFTADKNYVQGFDVNEGKEIDPTSKIKLGDKDFIIKEDFIPLAFSKIGFIKEKADHSSKIWIVDIGDTLNQNKDNPHFDLNNSLMSIAKNAIKESVDVVFLKNTSLLKDDINIDQKYKSEALDIPVIFLTNKGVIKFNETNSKTTFTFDIKTIDKNRTGHNVIGYINNNAANTIILGAHYDHLGYGEDHNSLYTGAAPMIHNGADDNASGTAALIEMSKWLKKSAYKKYNYLFISFSGEELGLFGSKYFTEHAGLDLKTVNYMINMDMVGRLNDSTHGITIGGYGTSPTWGQIIKKEDAYFKINIDSSGSGPSDHTSFYKKDIPVLFFFTGSHKDYHKPSDDADKINYEGVLQIIKYIQNIILQTNKLDKLAFTKTREVSMGKSSFKVSVGIMPDYTFTGNGVRVDGVSENKPAQKAGVQTGDVFIQLGEHKFSDVQSYMGVLNKFEKGQTTNLKLVRGKEEINLQITF